MPAVVLTGPEPLRRHHARALTPADATRIDCDDNPTALRELLASGGGLFTVTHIHARHLDLLDTTELKQLDLLLTDTAIHVTAEADTLTVAQEKSLAHATIRKLPGKAKPAAAYQEIAALLGTSLASADAARLETLAGGNHAAAVAVLELVAAAGHDRVTRDQIDRLTVNPDTPGLPWALLDAIDRADPARAAAEITRSEAIPTIAYAAKRWIAAALAAEGTDQDTATSLLGGNLTDSAWTTASRLATRTTASTRAATIAAIADADQRAKSSHPDEALALLAAALDTARH